MDKVSSRRKSPPGLIILALAVGLALPMGTAFSQEARGAAILSSIETSRFSIHYPPSAEAWAARTAGMADGILEDLEALFGFSLGYPRGGKKFPVLVTDVEPWLNGYFTTHPSNRIVIYASSAGVDSLASFQDELASVLLHELVHALTLNQRSGFWSFLSAVAGDSVAPTGWVMPNALVEGSAVWAESRMGGGRLNDPAALSQPALGAARGERLDIWDVSGLLEFPGSGNLAYVQGGLFAQYLEERSGAKALPSWWAAASRGDAFLGLGSLSAQGGPAFGPAWEGFGDWLGRKFPGLPGPADLEAWKPYWRSLDLDSRAFGPFALGQAHPAPMDPRLEDAGRRLGPTLYYVDEEDSRLKAVAVDKPDGAMEAPKRRPCSLLRVDGGLGELGILPESSGGGLRLSWYKALPKGGYRLAAYRFDPAVKSLKEDAQVPAENPGDAARNLSSGLPHLYQAQENEVGSWIYGLARMGGQAVPARKRPGGTEEEFELLLLPEELGLAVRSLSLDRSSGPEPERLALGYVPEGGIPSLALLDTKGRDARLGFQAKPFPGGIGRPSLDGSLVAFVRDLGNGEEEIAVLDLSAALGPGGAGNEFFEWHTFAWVSLEEWRQRGGAGSKEKPEARAMGPNDRSAAPRPGNPRPGRSSLFPRLLESTRYPYWQDETLGLRMEGRDLSQRLGWTFQAGWDYRASRPELGLSLDARLGRISLSLDVQDVAGLTTGGSSPWRMLIAQAGLGKIWPFLPARRNISTEIGAFFAPWTENYRLGDYFSPSFDGQAAGAVFVLGYSDLRNSRFPPYSALGLETWARMDAESRNWEPPLYSLSASLSWAPSARFSRIGIWGSYSLSQDLRFSPGYRRINATPDAESPDYGPSALAPAYPRFKEYEGLDAASPWYAFLQVSQPLASWELAESAEPWRIGFLPSPAFRRLVLEGGARAAVLELQGSIIAPGAVFLGARLESTLLAGLAAVSTLSFSSELSYALASPALGGGKFHLGFGMGVQY